MRMRCTDMHGARYDGRFQRFYDNGHYVGHDEPSVKFISSLGIWVASGHLGPGPFNIQIADARGHQVVILRVTLRPGRVIRTRTWMYGHGHRQAG